MLTVRKSLLQFVFSGSFMKRWNDKLRPVELVEVEKQAHKMMLAFVLYLLNSKDLQEEEQIELGEEVILKGIFDYFYRLIITDIKPPIYYKIKGNPAHFSELTSWVLEQLHPKIECLGESFWQKLVNYFKEQKEEGLSNQILEAAHLLASWWEFSLIRDLNAFDPEMAEIDASFKQQIQQYTFLQGVAELLAEEDNALKKVINLWGQLRFQKRWSQTPRIPETSVLGHLFIVACYAYFFSLVIGACPKRRQNNFFAGLFHDLPELLTRDIISPVKKSVPKISNLIREYEESELEKRIFSLLKDYPLVVERLKYFLGLDVGSEFTSTVILQEEVREVTLEQLEVNYNKDKFDPKDGELLKVCDNLAAFIEAYTAYRNGIMNEQLQVAIFRIKSQYQNYMLANKLHIGGLLSDFD